MSETKPTEQGDFKESLDVIATMLNKGNSLTKLGQYVEAIECFDNVIQLDPESYNAWHNKGKILETLGKSREAIVCYDKAVAVHYLNLHENTIQHDHPTRKLDPVHEELESHLKEEREVALVGKSSGHEIDPENIITLSDEDKNRIKEFIPKRFGTIQEFVTRAINVNAAWEEDPFTSTKVFGQKVPTMKQYHFLKESMSSQLLNDMFPNLTQKFMEEWNEYEKNIVIKNTDELKNNSKNQREERRDRKNFTKLKLELSSSQSYVEAKCKNIINDENEIKYDGWPLLFGHYSRIFPAQIGLHVLGNLMRELNLTKINFETFTKKAYDVAEEIATEYLAKERKDNTLKRVKKISIGLPRPYDDDEITPDQAIKEQRYKDRNFGKIKKTKDGSKTFEGLMSALGLIRVFENRDEVSVTFSEEGKKLYLMKNPIFEDKDDVVFSPEEQEFVINHLISKRELEAKLIEVAKKSIQDSKDGADTVKDIEQAFQDEIKKFTERCSDSNTSTRLGKMIKLTEDGKQTPIEAVRIATLGRMAELGIIDWKTNSEKKSLYSIAKRK